MNYPPKTNSLGIPVTYNGDSENKKCPQFSLKEISVHCHYDSCWIFIGNSVYNVTDYLNKHPGGAEIILEFAGSDATSAFVSKGHSKAATKVLKQYFIGQVTREDRQYSALDLLFEDLPMPVSEIPVMKLSELKSPVNH